MRHKNNKNKESFNKIRNKLQRKIRKNNQNLLSEIVAQKRKKNNSISIFNTIKTFSGNARKEQEELSEKQIESFNLYFTTIGKILSNKVIDHGQKNVRKKF